MTSFSPAAVRRAVGLLSGETLTPVAGKAGWGIASVEEQNVFL